MRNISDRAKEQYVKGSAKKILTLDFGDDRVYTNSQIVSESMSLNEILCDDDNIKFQVCPNSKFEITIADDVSDLMNAPFSAYIEIDNDAETKLPLGTFMVAEIEKNSGKPYRKITAYCGVKNMDKDVSTFYNNYSTANVTMAQFTIMLLQIMGYNQALIDRIKINSMPNANIRIGNFPEVSSITAGELLNYVCELNGVFMRDTQLGYLEVFSLKPQSALFPSEELYPSEDLFPAEIDASINLSNFTPSNNPGAYYNLLRRLPTISDYITQPINGVAIEANNEMYYMTDGATNPYYISNNYLALGNDNIPQMAQNLASAINGLDYRPSELECVGLPFLQLGDWVLASGKEDAIFMPILERTLSGIQMLIDQYEAKGTEYLNNDTTSIDSRLSRVEKDVVYLKNQSSAVTMLSNTDYNIDELVRRLEEQEARIQELENQLGGN